MYQNQQGPVSSPVNINKIDSNRDSKELHSVGVGLKNRQTSIEINTRHEHDEKTDSIPSEAVQSSDVKLTTTQSPVRAARIDEAGTNVTKVLLITSYRGGSTFLGEAFNRNEDVFYWFEPLISLESSRTNLSLFAAVYMVYLNGTLGYVRPYICCMFQFHRVYRLIYKLLGSLSKLYNLFPATCLMTSYRKARRQSCRKFTTVIWRRWTGPT